MAPKRKSTFPAPPNKKRNTGKAVEPNALEEKEPSPFFRLPAEIRNEIYALVCGGGGETAHLHPRSRGNLVHEGSPLAHVNKQLRNELLPVLAITVPIISAHVKDMDFAHVITFFNRCDDLELNALPTTDTALAHKRELRITLELTDKPHEHTDRIRRWVNRAARPEKKGANTKLEYRLGANRCFESCWRTARVMHQMKVKTMDLDKLRVLKDLAAAVDPEDMLRYFTGWYECFGRLGRSALRAMGMTGPQVESWTDR